MDFLSISAKKNHPAWLAGLCDYIECHATEGLTLENLATQAQVTPRALQYAFKRYFNTTPMRWVRQQKLKRVNHALGGGASGMNVTQAAIASGFTNLGVFARYYHEQYGELPSKTRQCHQD